MEITKPPKRITDPFTWPAQYVHQPTEEQKRAAAIARGEAPIDQPKAQPTVAVETPATEPGVATNVPTSTSIATDTPTRKSITERLASRQAQAAQTAQQAETNYHNSRAIFEQYHDDYVSGKRNPVADLIVKPKRDEAKEKRLKQVAVISAIADALGLIGKGYAAAHGVKPTVTEGVASNRAMAELRRLDDVYREEGYRYDQQRLIDALRRKSTEDTMQQYRLGLARDEHNAARTKAEAAENLTLTQQIADEERTYKADIRKEDNAREDRWRTQQLSVRGVNGGRHDDRHIVMMMTNPVTGEKVPIYEGQFYSLINDAVAKNPKLREELDAAQDANGEALKSKYMQIATNQYNEAVRSGKITTVKTSDVTAIIKNDAEGLRKNGDTTISIADVRYDLGAAAASVSDDELIRQYKQHGVIVTK